MTQDRPILTRYRMPVIGRTARGTPGALAGETVETAATLRAVAPGSLKPLRVETLTSYRRDYLVHEGRLWLALCTRGSSGVTRWNQPAGLEEGIALLGSGRGVSLSLHGTGPSPFAPFACGMRPIAVAEGYPGGAARLREAVAARVGDLFARDLVHDGRHVYVATRPPTIVLRRDRTGSWSYRAEPVSPYDPANDEIAFCVRRAERFHAGIAALDKELARTVRKEARRLAAPFTELAPDDRDLADLANEASVGALWLKGRLRRAPDPGSSDGAAFAGRLAAVRRRAALGIYGAIPEIERASAIEDAARLVRDLAACNGRAAVAPEMRAFLAYLDLVALPRIAEASPTPAEDLDGLGRLAP